MATINMQKYKGRERFKYEEMHMLYWGKKGGRRRGRRDNSKRTT
jgi:hypothetical protein